MPVSEPITFNTELATKALTELKKRFKRPSKRKLIWSQGVWRCETGMCYAGFVVEAAGLKWASDFYTIDGLELVLAEPTDPYAVNKYAKPRARNGQAVAGSSSELIWVKSARQAALDLLGHARVELTGGVEIVHNPSESEHFHRVVSEVCLQTSSLFESTNEISALEKMIGYLADAPVTN
jgi:hypothetical protein